MREADALGGTAPSTPELLAYYDARDLVWPCALVLRTPRFPVTLPPPPREFADAHPVTRAASPVTDLDRATCIRVFAAYDAFGWTLAMLEVFEERAAISGDEARAVADARLASDQGPRRCIACQSGTKTARPDWIACRRHEQLMRPTAHCPDHRWPRQPLE